ncbi:MAG: hypothetical protein LBH32_13905, partial [Dysgonamonadaceae bacterium]|nr:hypothetical protein [Dysgonamonadaceae bacterium]
MRDSRTGQSVVDDRSGKPYRTKNLQNAQFWTDRHNLTQLMSDNILSIDELRKFPVREGWEDRRAQALDTMAKTDFSDPQASRRAAVQIVDIINGKHIDPTEKFLERHAPFIGHRDIYSPDYLEKYILHLTGDFSSLLHGEKTQPAAEEKENPDRRQDSTAADTDQKGVLTLSQRTESDFSTTKVQEKSEKTTMLARPQSGGITPEMYAEEMMQYATEGETQDIYNTVYDILHSLGGSIRTDALTKLTEMLSTGEMTEEEMKEMDEYQKHLEEQKQLDSLSPAQLEEVEPQATTESQAPETEIEPQDEIDDDFFIENDETVPFHRTNGKAAPMRRITRAFLDRIIAALQKYIPAEVVLDTARMNAALGGNFRAFAEQQNKMEELERVNARFNEELDGVKNGTHKGILSLGKPLGILQAAGINSEGIELAPKVLEKKLKEHNLTTDDLQNLAQAIQTPIMVYQWGTKAKSTIIVTELTTKDGRKITVALRAENKGPKLEVNEVASIHGKAAERFLSEMENAKEGGLQQALKYVDKEKALNWLGLSTLSTNQGLNPTAKVIQEFENPKIDDENFVRMQNPDVRFLLTRNGQTIYGFTKNGVIYIDPVLINANTPIHEFGHLFNTAVRTGNPELWKRIVDLCKQTKLWNELQKNPKYAKQFEAQAKQDGISYEDAVADEVFATLLGYRGENNIKALMQQAEGDIPLFARVVNAINNFWDWIKENIFGVNQRFNNMNGRFDTSTIAELDAIADATLKEMFSGKPMNQQAKEVEDFLNNTEAGKQLVAQAVSETAKAKQQAEKVSTFIKDVLDGKITETQQFFEIPEYANRRAEKKLGHPITSHKVRVEEIKHIDNRHGINGTETKKDPNKIGLRKEDIALMPYVMSTADNIEKGISKRGKESIIYTKYLSNGKILVVEHEVSAGSTDMENISMWAEKNHSANVPSAKQKAASGLRTETHISENDVAKIRKDFETAVEKEQNILKQAILFMAYGKFQSEINEDDIYEMLGQNTEYTNEPHDILQSLEKYYGGKVVAGSSGARHALQNGLIPFGGNKYSGENEEYHHLRFADENGNEWVEAVPFETPQKNADGRVIIQNNAAPRFQISITPDGKAKVTYAESSKNGGQEVAADQSKYDFDVTGITEQNAEEMQSIKNEYINKFLENEKRKRVGGSTVRRAGYKPSVASDTSNNNYDSSARFSDITLDDLRSVGYMQAPNGKKSNLNEREWLQVRTPQFKKWFGDWEMANKLQLIEYLAAVGIKPHTYDRAQLDNIYKAIENGKNKFDNREVSFTHNVFGKMYRKDDSLFGKIVPQLKNIFDQSVPIYSEPEIKREGHKEHPNLVGYHNYLGKVTIDGKDYYVRFTVQEQKVADKNAKLKDGTPNQMHNTFVSEVELYAIDTKNKTANNLTDAATNGAKDVSGITDTKLQQFFETARAARENSSKVIDKNGEPQVVYHGTRYEFTTFDTPLNMERIFLTEDKNFAKKYGTKQMSLFPDVKNPLVADFEGRNAFDDIEVNGRTVEGIEDLADYARENGYDGVLARNVSDGGMTTGRQSINNEVIVFKPSQIKSSTNNNGNFDEQSNDIRFQFIGEQGAAALDKAEEATTRLDNLAVAREMEKAFAEKKLRLEKLKASKPIEITGKEITPSEDLKAYRKNALEYGKSLRGEYANKDTGRKILLARRGLDEVLHHDGSNIAHIQSIAAIPQIIEKGIFIDTVENEDTEKNKDVKSYDYYVAGLTINGVDYTVKAAIATDIDGNRYYDHALTQVEKGKLLDETARITSAPPHQGVELDYKDKRLLSILQTDDKENARKIKMATGWERNAEDVTGITEQNAAEMQAIKEAAIKNGTFMKAPNGKKSKLNEREWLQVRTPQFKKWFGNWELAIKYDYLLSEDWVSEITGNEFQKDGTPLTDKVTKYYLDKYNGQVERAGLGTVILDRRGVKDSLAHGIGSSKSAAYAAVPEIIKTGIIIDSQTNWKGRGYDTHVIAAPVKIGDKGYTGIVIVTQIEDSNRFYLHEVILQENLRNGFKTGQAGSPLGDVAKILQNLETAKNNSSKVVDENGEPMKVYHGTMDDDVKITTFDPKIDKPFRRTSAAAVFFTDSEENANKYATKYGYVIPAFLNIKSPFSANARKGRTVRRFGGKYRLGNLVEFILTRKKYFNEYKNIDGVIVENIIDNSDNSDNSISNVYAAFDPSQIKSSTDNNGNFDEQSNDIRFQFIGEQGAAALDKAEEATTRLDNLAVAREMEKAFDSKKKQLEKLKASKPIEIIGNEVTPSEDLAQYKKNAIEYGKKLQGEYINKDTGSTIKLQRGRKNGGIKEVLQHDYKDAEHLQSIAAIPQLIENSIYIDSAENRDKENHPDVKEYQYYVSGLKIGDVDYTVRSTVAVDNNGDRYYDHKLTQIEKGKLLDLAGRVTNPAQKQAVKFDGKDRDLFSILQISDKKTSAKKIKFATGWERGADGKWRYEINNIVIDKSKIKTSNIWDSDLYRYEGSLYDLIENKELFESYPQFKDVNVKIYERVVPWLPAGYYDYKKNELGIYWEGKYEKEHIPHTLAHEIQHLIQKTEGFAMGSHPNYFEKIREPLPAHIQEYSDLYDVHDKSNSRKKFVDWFMSLPIKRFKTPEIISIAQKTKTGEISRDEMFDITHDFHRAIQKHKYFPYDSYNKTSGEVEARNVSLRINMTPEERRASLAEETEDVSREDQIFIYDGFGAAESLPGKDGNETPMPDFKDYNGDLVKWAQDVAEWNKNRQIINKGQGTENLDKNGNFAPVINNKGVINYGELDKQANGIFDGTFGINALSLAEESGRIAGGRANVEATLLLRGDVGTDGSQQGDTRERQEAILKEYAQKRGIWISPETIADWKQISNDVTMEARVYRDEQSNGENVIKVGYNYLNFYETPLEWLTNKISLNNFLFPDTALELIGFTETYGVTKDVPGKLFAPVYRQKYVKARVLQDSELNLLKEEMSKNGFKKKGYSTYYNDNYVINDLHVDNVMIDEDGNYLFIDTVPRLNTPGQNLNGKREYGDYSLIETLQGDTDDDLRLQAAITDPYGAADINAPNPRAGEPSP